MALGRTLKKQMRQTLFVANPTSQSFGDLAYSAPVETLARIEESRDIVNNADGDAQETTHLIATDGEIVGAAGTFVTITKQSRLWFFGADETKDEEARLPASVDNPPDSRGDFHHFEVRV